ncbi:MAG: VacJ family lipoprotein [Pseudomonadota bacterium]
MKKKDLSCIFTLLAVLTFNGCASVPGKGDPRDPLEDYNRAVYKFNDTVDRAVLKPVAKGYDFVVPDLVKTGVGNVFSNLGELVVIFNDALQGKGEQAVADMGRFIINSTFGMVGLFDIATPAGLPKHNEDFGQTLGKWGVNSGPYFVLPLLGPSTIRDTSAKIVDRQLQYPAYVEHVPTRNSAYALDIVNTRSTLLGASNALNEAALDPYVFVRDAYLQRRQRLVYDGNPPKEKDDFYDEEDLEETSKDANKQSDGEKK